MISARFGAIILSCLIILALEVVGMAQERPHAGAERPGARRHAVKLLLLVPLVGTLVPEFYNRTAPSIGGMPFFYWYQLAWIPISVAITLIVYRATRRER